MEWPIHDCTPKLSAVPPILYIFMQCKGFLEGSVVDDRDLSCAENELETLFMHQAFHFIGIMY